MSIESIINQSLDLVGHKRHIGSIYDGSTAARVALNAYAETRDEVLAMRPWMFARAFTNLVRSTELTALTGQYAWLRPESAIVILDVYPPERTSPEPTRWFERYYTDGRLIITSFTPAQSAITQRILDPDDWSPDFTFAVIQSLARRFASLVEAPKKDNNSE
jgi:hypothetical protein